jgi:hypothetical protein
MCPAAVGTASTAAATTSTNILCSADVLLHETQLNPLLLQIAVAENERHHSMH